MKILLDESTPGKLRAHLRRHDVFTAKYMGWAGLLNGSLLAAAEAEGFELLITSDKNLAYQQNMSERRIGLLVLTTNNWDTLLTQIERVQFIVDGMSPGDFLELEE